MTLAGSRSPLPFGVLPPGYYPTDSDSCGWRVASPLPFGVLPPGYATNFGGGEISLRMSPLPFGVLPPGYALDGVDSDVRFGVSIAFRRSAPRLPAYGI